MADDANASGHPLASLTRPDAVASITRYLQAKKATLWMTYDISDGERLTEAAGWLVGEIGACVKWIDEEVQREEL